MWWLVPALGFASLVAIGWWTSGRPASARTPPNDVASAGVGESRSKLQIGRYDQGQP